MELEVRYYSDPQEQQEAALWSSAQEGIGSCFRRQNHGGRGDGTDRAAWRMRKGQRREPGLWDGGFTWTRGQILPLEQI